MTVLRWILLLAIAGLIRTASAQSPPALGYTSTNPEYVSVTTLPANGVTISSWKPTSLTLVPLDVASVTTGGTAVTALAAGHRTAGGWIQNPVGATTALCIDEIDTATGTTSSGNTTCVQPGQIYNLAPGTGAVTVVSSDNTHAFSGEGFE